MNKRATTDHYSSLFFRILDIKGPFLYPNLAFLLTNFLINQTTSQSGFHTAHSCESTINHIIAEWRNAIFKERLKE